jgi:hypothetical protein
MSTSTSPKSSTTEGIPGADSGNSNPREATRGLPMRSRTRAWYLLLVVPMIGTLIPSIYNKKDPTLIGIPFFYWYQLLVVVVGAVLTAIVYFATRD